MTVVLPTGCASAAFIMSEGGGAPEGSAPFIWTLGLLLGGTTPEPSFANELVGLWSTHIGPITFNEYVLERIDLLVPVGGSTAVVSSSAPIEPGSRTGDPAFSLFAPNVKKVSAIPGRKHTGRCHPPGTIAEGAVTHSGTITSGARDFVNDAFADFHAALIDGEITPVILHQAPSALDPDPITAFQVQTKVGVLRNRLL